VSKWKIPRLQWGVSLNKHYAQTFSSPFYYGHNFFCSWNNHSNWFPDIFFKEEYPTPESGIQAAYGL
jgi:hypothetical protein